MTTYRIVTSFSDKLWTRYASQTVPTLNQNRPEDSDFHIWFNGDMVPEWKEKLTDVEFRDLNKLGDYQAFRKEFKFTPRPKVEKGHEFRFNFLPFWNKVCALYHAMKEALEEDKPCKYLLWFDADLFSSADISEERLESWIQNKDIASLTRSKPWNTWETGFIAFKVHEANLAFIKDVYNLYTSGMIFDFNEWHDAYLFTVLWKKHKKFLSHAELNLVPSYGHCFDSSILPPFLCHLKGGERKITGSYYEVPQVNAVLLSDYTGPINVKDPVVHVLKKNGQIDAVNN